MFRTVAAMVLALGFPFGHAHFVPCPGIVGKPYVPYSACFKL
jgi:hypothetical protein